MKGERGFTLVEVLVALAILVLGLAGLFRSLDFGVRNTVVVDHRRAALDTAQLLLAELGHSRPLRPGVASGELLSGQRWRLTIEQVPGQPRDTREPVMTAHAVTVLVTWTERAQPVSLSFQAVRLGLEPQ